MVFIGWFDGRVYSRVVFKRSQGGILEFSANKLIDGVHVLGPIPTHIDPENDH